MSADSCHRAGAGRALKVHRTPELDRPTALPARERRRPIAATVNAHWHLDHSSGKGGEGRLSAGAVDPDLPAVRREERELFLAKECAAGWAK